MTIYIVFLSVNIPLICPGIPLRDILHIGDFMPGNKSDRYPQKTDHKAFLMERAMDAGPGEHENTDPKNGMERWGFDAFFPYLLIEIKATQDNRHQTAQEFTPAGRNNDTFFIRHFRLLLWAIL